LFGFKKKNNTFKNENGALDSKALSEIILSTIDDGVALLDKNGVIQMTNPAAGKIIGWEQKDMNGLDYASVFIIVNEKNEPLTNGANPIARTLLDGVSHRDNNAYILTKNKKAVALGITVTPLLEKNQLLNGAVIVLRDVTNERYQDKQRAEFISTASHEMRTPVAAIEGYLALALNDKVARIDDKARSYLEKAHDSTQHLGKLFQDLLTTAKAEDGRLQNNPQEIEVGDLLQKLTEDMRFTAEKKGLSVDYLIGASKDDASIASVGPSDSKKVIKPLYYINADKDRITEVILNLFDNAFKYTETGKITVGLTGDKNVVQIRIQDTGNGISAEDIPHLFEKFYRVDNTATRAIGGTGLGLFICKKVIEMYDGRIWVNSEVGKGSTFYINLPRVNKS
jgi:two-component system, OmpR family, sensor histidine kinase VicK